ncbi:hypothetical protein M501DRAFT_999597 [Patellaria atrata CBS 101060]|uniref:Ras GEF n=1 Tax=Patellaria atrata CBS 101060 TaxID=1346257 RepID=A0A9P4VMV6_9PEZI|nr:hypothetical protein M501DRAFT_999597 [Patellaria atrata CBS 101060]
MMGQDGPTTHPLPTRMRATTDLSVNPPPQGVKRKVGDDDIRRRPRQNSLRRAKNSTEALRARRGGSNDISAESGAAARGGRQFTVGNVGNNGVIYLRPVIQRAPNQSRPAPDPFVFPPVTPPDSANTEGNKNHPERASSHAWRESFLSGSRTSSRHPHRDSPPPPVPKNIELNAAPRISSSPKRPRHIRSHSFSTVDEHTNSQSGRSGTFKVVIERPSLGGRPKTSGSGAFPILEVPIPNYRLGTPRFSARGTAILRSSVYTRASGTDDFRSSVFSRVGYDKLFPAPPGMVHQSMMSRRHSDAFVQGQNGPRSTINRSNKHVSQWLQPSTARTSKVTIGPQLYDILAINPDDNSVVRFSPTGEVLAATPSRLILHITSDKFLDYELVSSFFLTFRSFLSTSDVVDLLLARLRWAVDRADQSGRVVRVRVFAALRHWILNYFEDDFLLDYDLRLHFCSLVNDLCRELRSRGDSAKGDLNILRQLKRSWKNTCMEFWDFDNMSIEERDDDDILPGGAYGTRDSQSVPSQVSRPFTPHHPQGKLENAAFTSYPIDTSPSKPWQQGARHIPQQSLTSALHSSMPYSSGATDYAVPLSPASEQSMQVLSCSIPMRGLHRTDPGTELPLYPHPHPVPAVPASSPTTAVKPFRPGHARKRSGSFSDALRDHRNPMQVAKSPPKEYLLAGSHVPGRLVRGAIIHPGSPYIDARGPRSLRSVKSVLDFGTFNEGNTPGGIPKHSLVSSPALRKILGSVRRAMSNKQGQPLSTIGIPRQQTPPGSATGNSGPTVSTTFSVADTMYKRRHARGRPQIRIDLLAAKVSESYKHVVLEVTSESGQPKDYPSEQDEAFAEPPTAPAQDIIPKPDRNQNLMRLNSNVTMGSASIVIFDDTGAPDLPLMSGALHSPNPDKELIAEATRRSLALQPAVQTRELENHRRDYSLDSIVASPPRETAELQMSVTEQQDVVTPLEPAHRSPPLRRPSLLRHSQSVRSARSGSTSLRRYASYQSGIAKHQRKYSVASALSDVYTQSSEGDPFVLERQPAHQLRRRPGGNLRGVGNVNDLEHRPRPRSTGSISTQSYSMMGSTPIQEDTDGGEPAPRRLFSLIQSHSSQPNLRPSFQAEADKIAQIPDDDDDDGGVDTALMKLEGRYEKRSPDVRAQAGDGATSPVSMGQGSGTRTSVSRTQVEPDQQHEKDIQYFEQQPQRAESQVVDIMPSPLRPNRPRAESAAASEDSYSSVPLLDRGLSDIDMIRTRQATRQQVIPVENPLPPATPVSSHRLRNELSYGLATPGSSIEHVVETDSMRRIRRGSTLPRSPAATHQSFLLEDDESFSDVAVEAVEDPDPNHDVRSFFDDESPNMDLDEFLPHPLRLPPTPPPTKPESPTVHKMADLRKTEFPTGLPTPGLTPTLKIGPHYFSQGGHGASPTETQPIELADLKPNQTPQAAAHLPFILAYDSKTLAQHFTIVERDALEGIDWFDLIEIQWSHHPPDVRDWVTYLSSAPKGKLRSVDLVIARFNLMSKWAISEIVLCEILEERVSCISKYIHIAAHARQLHNYATMYQLTTALTSNDVTRLTKTWDLVSPSDLRTLKSLETLVQPFRNFHTLRREIEMVSPEEPCIPFLGLYTKDLVYNAQKPAYIDNPTGQGEKLVNFERHHTAATIVKGLLRLVSNMGRYEFPTIQGDDARDSLLGRCLWMASLSDEEIRRRSKALEP